MSLYDVAVIGEGVAGLAAANLAAKAGLAVATFEAIGFGGLVLGINHLDPAPGDEACGGAEFAGNLWSENADLGVESVNAEVQSIEAFAAGFRLHTSAGVTEATQVVLASGARLRPLAVPGAKAFTGKGMSSCADCDGPMYAGQDVVVVGAGDSALQEALVLADYCRKVVVLLRGDAFRGAQRRVDALLAHPQVEDLRQAQVREVLGDRFVTGVRVACGAEGREREIACAGVFPFIGLQPNSGFLPAAVATDGDGFVLTDEEGRTSLAGVWALGAVRAGFAGHLQAGMADAQRLVAALAR